MPTPEDSPAGEAIDHLASTLSPEDKARYYGRLAARIATMEEWLGQDRAHRAFVGRSLAKDLRELVAPHSLEVDGYRYRAHRDGGGVQRERIGATREGPGT
jgi:hypothetical protein